MFVWTLMFHVALAGSVLMGCLLLGEIYVPGSVLPFLDIVNGIPILIALVCGVEAPGSLLGEHH
jgi:hypothetical protein